MSVVTPRPELHPDRGCDICVVVSFEAALEEGRLEDARSMLDERAWVSDTSELWLPECYADLAKAFDRRGQQDDAISALQTAIELGWTSVPDARSDIAEFHLRAGRDGEAARIWAQLKAEEPEDVWLYNGAGLSYSEVGDHEQAVTWLGEGIQVAMRSGDPEGLVAQLSDVRRQNLEALARELDELEQQADEFIAQWHESRRDRFSLAEASRRADDGLAAPGVSVEPAASPGVPVAMAWFPAGEYEKAIELWASLAEDWEGVAHPDYCRRMDGHIKWMRARGVRIRAIAPIVVEEFVAWCQDRGEDPEDARAHYAADFYRLGGAIDWPPGRNEPCWCASGRKYKKCCGEAQAAPMHAGAAP